MSVAVAETSYTAEELAAFQRLKDDFPFYASRCLKIRAETGETLPLVLNEPQRLIHERIEQQRAKTGRVRAVILKGRQQGCSTLVQARYYWRVTHARGLRAFILAHEIEASNNLFEIASRFHDYCPDLERPTTGAANAKELHFPMLDSGYRVATAGSKGAGRSLTAQLFHGSEVAFWPSAEEHASGALQAVPNVEGTEIILESTANGVGNYYHRIWQDAERGDSDYQAIFVPWYMSKKYRRPVPAGFKLTGDEATYLNAYNLDLEQMVWRREKIRELKDEWLFKREYPATAAEAFETSGDDSFIPPVIVAAARKNTDTQMSGPLVIGVDPARFGNDATAIIRRRNRVAFGLERHRNLDSMSVAGLVAKIINDERPRRVFIDVGGTGAGTIDRLRELGYRDVVEEVNFGSAPVMPRAEGGSANRRAEMWDNMREWLRGSVKIPDDDTLHADLTGPKYSFDSASRLLLEAKDKMRARGLKSPDSGDALALTFAASVVDDTWARKLDYSHINRQIV